MIISFAWTTPAVVIGEKTETRRDWAVRTIAGARRVSKLGELVDAYDRSPRVGGKKFGEIRIKDVYPEVALNVPDRAFRAEGFHVLSKLGAKFMNQSTAADVWKFWKQCDESQTVVVFELVNLNDYGHELRAATEKKLLELATGNPV